MALAGSPKRRRFNPTALREALTGYLFLLPAALIVGIFGLFPIGYALYMSLYRYRGPRRGSFQGLEQYADILGNWWGALAFFGGLVLLLVAYLAWFELGKRFERRWGFKLLSVGILAFAIYAINNGWVRMLANGDDDFLHSIVITLYYALGAVPTQLAIGLLLAYVLFQNLRGQEFFRMLFFLPYITPVVAAAVVFRTIFTSRETGLANQALSFFGLPIQDWIFESKPITEILFGVQWDGFWAGPSLALVATIIFGVWTYAGYNAVILLAGLSGIPKDLYEAAEIDGANGWQSFWGITLPLLSPVTFYLGLIGFIGTFQAFNHIYVMRTDFARDTMDVTSVVIFDTFYKANQYGYAAAEAIILFVIILFLTIAQNVIFGRRVFYG